MSFHWTEERDAVLVEVARAGGTSADAARKLGVSRNAAIGRAHRTGVRFGRSAVPVTMQETREPSPPRLLEPVAKPRRPSRANPATSPYWTPAQDDLLRECIAKGMMAEATADLIGKTQSAVRSRCKRLKIGFGSKGGVVRKAIVEAKAKARAVAIAAAPAFGSVSLLDLERHHCRYIPGDPRAGGLMYCGERREPGSSFCPAHHALCYVPVRVG